MLLKGNLPSNRGSPQCQFQIVRRHEKQLHYLWSIYTYFWLIASNLITFHAENFFL